MNATLPPASVTTRVWKQRRIDTAVPHGDAHRAPGRVPGGRLARRAPPQMSGLSRPCARRDRRCTLSTSVFFSGSAVASAYFAPTTPGTRSDDSVPVLATVGCSTLRTLPSTSVSPSVSALALLDLTSFSIVGIRKQSRAPPRSRAPTSARNASDVVLPVAFCASTCARSCVPDSSRSAGLFLQRANLERHLHTRRRSRPSR